jgi:hypothetical protein
MTNSNLHQSHQGIGIRVLGEDDRDELGRLAEIDSASALHGSRNLGAEVDGKLIAAVSLDDGRLVADPFRLSGEAVELLRLRARQLGGMTEARRRGRLSRVLNGLRRGHAYAGLAGSPPGAGGRLLNLKPTAS